MTTFHSKQSDCGRRARKNENAGTFHFTSQIASSICTVAFTKCEKSDATIFTSRCSRMSMCYRFRGGQALPLIFIRLSRLAGSSPTIRRNPPRRSRNVRDTTDKKAGEMSRVIAPQCPRNGRPATNIVSPDDRRGDSQGNSCPAPNLAARWPRRKLVRQLATCSRNNLAAVRATANAKFRKLLTGISWLTFSYATQEL